MPRPKLTLSQRINLALGAVMASAVLVAVLIALQIRSLGALSEDAERVTRAAQAAYELDLEALQVMVALRRYRDTHDPEALEDIEAARVAARSSRARLRAHTRLPQIVAALDRYEAMQPRRIELADQIIASVREGRTDARVREAIQWREQLDAEVRGLLHEVLEVEQRELTRILELTAGARQRFLRNVLALIAGALLVIGLLFWTLVAGGVSRRLTQLTAMARQVAAGDYSQREFANRPDEIGVLANALNEMAGQLARFDKVKEEFVALASHQLRTPATAVKGNLGMLLEGFCGELTAEQREVVADANASNERQLAVIEDMLWVARTDSGRLVLQRAPTDLAQLAAEVVAEQQPVASQRRQDLKLEKPAAAVVVSVDAQKLRMVFENLVSNASKYTPEGGRIAVTVGANGTGATLAVRDSGVGIAAEDLPKLFGKFSRIANPLSEQVGGTGLGLYLAQEIVKLHGGNIGVQSEPGAGTTFTVSLPLEAHG